MTWSAPPTATRPVETAEDLVGGHVTGPGSPPDGEPPLADTENHREYLCLKSLDEKNLRGLYRAAMTGSSLGRRSLRELAKHKPTSPLSEQEAGGFRR